MSLYCKVLCSEKPMDELSCWAVHHCSIVFVWCSVNIVGVVKAYATLLSSYHIFLDTPRIGVGRLFGVEGRMSPKELAAGRTGNLREKFNNCTSPSPSLWCHVISAKALRGNVEISGIFFRIVLRSTPPVFSCILFFHLHQKFPILLD